MHGGLHWECKGCCIGNAGGSALGMQGVLHWECKGVCIHCVVCLGCVGYVVLYPGYLSQNGEVLPYGATHLYILYQPAFLYTSPIYGGLSH